MITKYNGFLLERLKFEIFSILEGHIYATTDFIMKLKSLLSIVFYICLVPNMHGQILPAQYGVYSPSRPVSNLSGLVLHLDAGNTSSYPGTGTTWTDLSGNGYNGTFTNGPIFSAANGGCIVFDGVNDYVAGGNLGSFYSQGTISYWMYSTAVENYRNPFSTNYNGVNVGIRFEQYTSASPYGGFSVIIGNDAGTYTGFSYSPSAILTVEVPSATSQ
mgnify:CR=1 FL=1